MMSATVEERLADRLRYTETIPLKDGLFEMQWVDLAKVKEILERLGFDLYTKRGFRATTIVSVLPSTESEKPLVGEGKGYEEGIHVWVGQPRTPASSLNDRDYFLK